MPAGDSKRFIKGTDAYTTLYQSANIIDMALEGVDQLYSARQYLVLGHVNQMRELTYSRCLGPRTTSSCHFDLLGLFKSYIFHPRGVAHQPEYVLRRLGANARVSTECGGGPGE